MKLLTKLTLAATGVVILAVGAAGQIDPKPYLANKKVDFSQARSLPYLTADQVMFENVLVDYQHFALLMGWKRAKFEPIELRRLNTVKIPTATISIDGVDTDSAGIPPVIVDPAGDADPFFDREPGTDMANVYLARDQQNLYILMTMHNGGPTTIPDSMYTVELQQYLYQIHTPGDLIIAAHFDLNRHWLVEVMDRGPGQFVAFYPEGHVATGDGFVEWAVPLADLQNPSDVPLPYFPAGPRDRGIENRFIRAYIHPGPHPASPVADINYEMTRPMIVNFYQ